MEVVIGLAEVVGEVRKKDFNEFVFVQQLLDVVVQ